MRAYGSIDLVLVCLLNHWTNGEMTCSDVVESHRSGLQSRLTQSYLTYGVPYFSLCHIFPSCIFMSCIFSIPHKLCNEIYWSDKTFKICAAYIFYSGEPKTERKCLRNYLVICYCFHCLLVTRSCWLSTVTCSYWHSIFQTFIMRKCTESDSGSIFRQVLPVASSS